MNIVISTFHLLNGDIDFYFSGSTLCFLHLLIPNRPLILSGNDTIVLAPYHTYYGKLEEHMMKAGISLQPNLWDQPLCVGQYTVCLLELIHAICVKFVFESMSSDQTFKPKHRFK